MPRMNRSVKSAITFPSTHILIFSVLLTYRVQLGHHLITVPASALRKEVCLLHVVWVPATGMRANRLCCQRRLHPLQFCCSVAPLSHPRTNDRHILSSCLASRNRHASNRGRNRWPYRCCFEAETRTSRCRLLALECPRRRNFRLSYRCRCDVAK